MIGTRLVFLSISWLGVAVSAFAGPYSTYNGVGSNAADQPIAASDSRFVEWASDTNYVYSPTPGVGPNYQNPAGFMSLGNLYNPSSPPATGKTPDWHMGTRASQNLYPFSGNVCDLTDTYGFTGIDNPGSIYTTSHSIYEAWPTEDLGGFDFRFVANPSTGDTASVGVLNAVPEPGSLALLVAATLGYVLFAVRRRLGL